MTDSYNQNAINLATAPSLRPLFNEFATLGGDGVTTNANGDYSAAPIEFFIAPDSTTNDVITITSLTVQIQDVGTFDTGSYGNAITLTNGIRVVQTFDPLASPPSSGQLQLNDLPVITNVDWYNYSGDSPNPSTYGTGNDVLTITWDFSASGTNIRLFGSRSQRLGVVLNDDFSALASHTFNFKGIFNSGGPSI